MDLETRKKRARCITGTDIGAILGLNPYKTGADVWMEKKELVEINIDNEFTRWGNKLEDVIAERYSEVTGHALKGSEFISQGIFGGTPDRLCADDESIGLEIKSAGWRQAVHYGEPGSDQVPNHYLLQCVWYMMLTNRSRWDLAVLIGGNDFRIYTILRNLALEAHIEAEAEAWWQRFILGNIQPDLTQGQYAKAYLSNHYLNNNGKMIATSPEIEKIAEQYAKVKEKIDALEKVKETCENRLKAFTGEHDGTGNDLFKFTWKQTKSSQVLDKDALIAELNPSPDLIKKHTTAKEGYRRIYFTHHFNLKQEN
jgi:putative phage-type endonuclease